MSEVPHITPTRDEFLAHGQAGNLIPVYREILSDFETPLSAYRKIRSDGEAFLCESVEGGEHLSRYSFVGCNPRGIIRQDGDQVKVVEEGKATATYTVSREPGEYHVRDGLEVVEKVLGRYQAVDLPGLPRFTGGAMGFVGYEFIHDVEPVVPRPPKDELGTPTMYFLIADELLIFDRVRQTVTILVNAIIEDGIKPDDAYEDAVDEVERLVSLLEQPSEHRPVTLATEPPPASFESNMEKETFLANVAKSKGYIRAGDIIQVVGSQRFSTEVKADPLDVYRAVRSINPSPYMFHIKLNGFDIIGASPELLVKVEENEIEIRPIAGTYQRGVNAEADAQLADELLKDDKERAEHLMLVDLGRNDVGRASEFDTVQVIEFMVVEYYSHVMHIVSDVRGTLHKDKDVFDALYSGFPAGTLTGAPKIRAMEIINELEPNRRGVYAGAIGFFDFTGEMNTCIAIRTMVMKDGTVYFQSGAGIVYDSDPTMEYDETVNKAKAINSAIDLAEKGLVE